MKLLVITRKVDVNDERMGFFVDWLNALAKRLDKLFVISVQSGSRQGLADNVETFFTPNGNIKALKQENHESDGAGLKTRKQKTDSPKAVKENFFTKQVRRFFVFLRFRKLLKQILPQVDGVFVHMIPLYANLAGPLVKKHGKRMILWYTHKSVDRALRKTEKFVDGYATASQLSFRMATVKPVHVLGHGINISKFKIQNSKFKTKEDFLKILTVGRIAQSKNLEVLIESVELLVTSYQLPVTCFIIGSPALLADKVYLEKLKYLTRQYGLEKHIKFLGAQPHEELPKYYQVADVFVNLSDTGSLDKSVLEAMAAETLVLTSNQAFVEVLEDLAGELMFKAGDSGALARKLDSIYKLSEASYNEFTKSLQRIVLEKHSLDGLTDKIIKLYE